ncbi:MAG: VWA domain-containing protein [Candidatus Thiodiazotropha sp. (ex. Lucinisca nassula)]|nr:VWA domain-containing protein [Candidatus Thiodiazotropha sp. (ex. Lucinisca nassula)]MCG7866538.1 VWA domain-containing protein [Candidatus Thiodiazotropha taylori]
MKAYLTLLSVVFSLLLNGCSGPVEQVSILAGSELKDIKPMLEEIKRETGVEIEFHFTGTLDGAETLASGAHYDMGWFSHAKYLSLLEGRANQKFIHGSEKIMLSPVVAGVKKSVADRWGWCDNAQVSWKEFSDKAAQGELTYAMTNPASSNSGFSSTVGVQSALAGGETLQPDMIDNEAMSGFARGHKLTAGSSGWLADKFVAEQHQVDAIFNYESVLIGLNESGQLREPLCLIYPPEGVITADYPLLLLNKAKQQAFSKLIDYFKQQPVQQRLMSETARRPVIPGVALDKRFPDAVVLELPFPGKVETVDQILMTYLDKQRAPSTSIFVLDLSGSMRGDNLQQLKQAMHNLAGGDQSITGKFARFRAREQVIILPFSSQPMASQTFDIESGVGNDPVLQQLRNEINQLVANGGTAIYSALDSAYGLAKAARAQDSDRFYSIALLSDGANTQGLSYGGFRDLYRQNHDDYAGIPTFPIIFGGADKQEMEKLAHLTGGRAFDSTKHSLSQVFKKIRGYQ